jgi:hypothetical protein
MAINLDSAAINIALIREQARKDLCDALDSRRGKKALVLDPKLSGPLSLIAEISLLKEHGVENLYYLENEPIETDCRTIIYLVRHAHISHHIPTAAPSYITSYTWCGTLIYHIIYLVRHAHISHHIATAARSYITSYTWCCTLIYHII